VKNNLKKYRKKAGFTHQKLADECGLSKSHVWEIEVKQTSSPTLKTAYAISAILGVTVFDIWPNTVEIVEEIITVRRIKK